MLYDRLFPSLDGKWLENPVEFGAELKALPLGDAEVSPALDPAWCTGMVKTFHQQKQVDYSYGGYLEDRAFLWRGSYIPPGAAIHLGVDYNVPVLSWVQLPQEGRLVMLEVSPDPDCGWGGRAIYQIGDNYVIFAHLCNLQGIVGRQYSKGQMVGQIANYPENGNWYPHLHVQCCRVYDINVDGYGAKYEGMEKDFPNPAEVL